MVGDYYLYVFGKSLHQPIYQFLHRALGRGCRGRICSPFPLSQVSTPIHWSMWWMYCRCLPSRSVVTHSSLSSGTTCKIILTRRNLMVFDDLMLNEQNKYEDYVRWVTTMSTASTSVRITSNYLANRYGTKPNLICLFKKDAKNFDHIHRDYLADLTKGVA